MCKRRRSCESTCLVNGESVVGQGARSLPISLKFLLNPPSLQASEAHSTSASTNSPIETNFRPLRFPSARKCRNASILRVASLIPSCRITMVPGARFFSISHRMYFTGGSIGSCGYAQPKTHVYPRSRASLSCHGHATPPGARKSFFLLIG